MPADVVVAARRLAADVLEPVAEQVDVEGVPPSHVAALKQAGLLGATAPMDIGGGGAGPADGRDITEALSGACGATWFVATQHGMPLKTLQRSENDDVRGRWLQPLATSSALAGVAVSHLRRPSASVVATAAEGGWRVDGRVDWMTSWGLADVVLLGAVAGEDVVLALLPARDAPGVQASAPLRLAAMNGAHNVSLTLQGLLVRAEDVVLVQPWEDWKAADALATVNVTPAVFGLLGTIVRRLAVTGTRRGSAEALDLAAQLDAEGDGLRKRAYALIDEAPPDSGLAERLEVRAHALELLNRAAVALVVAGAGTSMLLTNPAQRLAREALFHLIQAQTGPVRDATLRRLATQTRAD